MRHNKQKINNRVAGTLCFTHRNNRKMIRHKNKPLYQPGCYKEYILRLIDKLRFYQEFFFSDLVERKAFRCRMPSLLSVSSLAPPADPLVVCL